MAIDIIVRDGVADSIAGKMLTIAAAAEKLEAKAKAAQVAVNALNGGSVASKAAAAAGYGRSTESAYVTATKRLTKQRSEIAEAFNRGMVEQHKKAAAAIAEIEKATAKLSSRQSLNRSIVQPVPELTQAKTKAAQMLYNDLFGAHNITTAPLVKNMQQVIGEVTGSAIKQSGSAAQKAQQQLYDNLFGATSGVNLVTSGTSAKQLAAAIQQNTGTAIQQASATSQRQMQAYYNNLFGAHNINTKAAASNIQKVISQATGTGIAQATAAQQKSRQAMYDNLFNAKPIQQQANPANVSLWAKTLQLISPASNTAATGVNRLSGAMSQLNSSASFLRSDGLRWAKVLTALGGATLTAGALVQMADAYTRVQNRLSTVAESQEHVNKLTRQVAEAANSARQPIEETAKLFARVDLSMQQLGRTQTDSMKITENVSKALKLGGATAGEAASAMLQLSQAFNKGKLDGDEFRSVMENSPVLADALAKQLKVTRGELLKLAPEGKITATVMADAIINATKSIDEAFKKLRPTIEESFTVFRNHAMMYYGELDKQIGLTAAVSNAIMGVAKHLDVLTFAFLALTPAVALFVGTKTIGGIATFSAWIGRAAVTVGSLRSPLTVATVGMYNLSRAAVSTGATIVSSMTAATARVGVYRAAVAAATTATMTLGTVAARAGGLMLAAFSFGNVIMMIGVAVAALIAFGDRMVVNAELGVTMRDRTIAAFSVMADYVEKAFSDTFDYVQEGMGNVVKESQTTSEKVLVTVGAVADGAASFADSLLTLFNWIGHGIAALFTVALETIGNVMKTIVNIISSVTNLAIGAINGAMNVFSSMANFAVRVGNMFGGNFSEVSPTYINQIAMMSVHWNASAEAVAKLNNQQEIGVTIAERSLATYRKDIAVKEKAIAASRKEAEAAAKRTPAAAAADEAKKGGKKGGRTDAEKREDLIKKVILAETAALEAAKLYGDYKEQFMKIEELNNQLKLKRFAELSAGEKSIIQDLIIQRQTAERVGEAMQEMYTRYLEPQKKYMAAIAGINNMLGDNKLTAEQAEAANAKLNHEYNMSYNAVYKYKDALDQELMTLGKVGEAYTRAAAVREALNAARDSGMPTLTPMQVTEVSNMAADLERAKKMQAARTAIWDETGGALTDLEFTVMALETAQKSGAISAELYARKIAAVWAETGKLNESILGITDPFEPMYRGFHQFVADMPSLGQSMADAISGSLGNAVSSLSSTLTEMIVDFKGYTDQLEEQFQRPLTSLEVMQHALGTIINQIGKELINAVIQMGVQMAIQRVMQSAQEKAAAAQTIATTTATAAATAAAWTPAAITASTATMGSAPATGLTAWQMALVAGAGLALAMIPAFKDGGLIGGMGTGRSDSTLARVSRGEMVMNRSAVQSNYPLLSAMNSGAVMGGMSSTTYVSITYNGGDGDRKHETNDTELARGIMELVDNRVRQLNQESRQQGHENYL